MPSDPIQNLRDHLDEIDADNPFAFFSYLGDDDMVGQVNIGQIVSADPLLDMAALHLLSIHQTLNEEDGQSVALEEVAGVVLERSKDIRDNRPYGMRFGED